MQPASWFINISCCQCSQWVQLDFMTASANCWQCTRGNPPSAWLPAPLLLKKIPSKLCHVPGTCTELTSAQHMRSSPKNWEKGEILLQQMLGGGSELDARSALGSPKMLRTVPGHLPGSRGERTDVLAERLHVCAQRSLLLQVN